MVTGDIILFSLRLLAAIGISVVLIIIKLITNVVLQ